MPAATVAPMYDMDFFFYQNAKMMNTTNNSTSQVNCVNTQQRRNFPGSPPMLPMFNNRNNTYMPLQPMDICYPFVQQKPMRQNLPQPNNMPTSPITPPTHHLQRRDSMRSDSSQGSTADTELARYKTELCRPFEETGHCRYGSKCQYAHGKQELRPLNRHPKYKTELCRTFHTTGFCSYGQRCNYIHNDEERRTHSQASTSVQQRDQRPQRPSALVLSHTMPTSTGESPASSVNGDSPSQSPGFLNDDVFAAFRLSPTPSFGSSDCCSLTSSASSFPSPPATPRHDIHEQLTSPLDMGLNLPFVFSNLRL